MRHAIVRNGRIENLIELEPDSGWPAPEGTRVHPLSDEVFANPGWLLNDGKPEDPNPPAEPPKELTTAEKLAGAGISVDELVDEIEANQKKRAAKKKAG